MSNSMDFNGGGLSFCGLSRDETETYRLLAEKLFESVQSGDTVRHRYI